MRRREWIWGGALIGRPSGWLAGGPFDMKDGPEVVVDRAAEQLDRALDPSLVALAFREEGGWGESKGSATHVAFQNKKKPLRTTASV